MRYLAGWLLEGKDELAEKVLDLQNPDRTLSRVIDLLYQAKQSMGPRDEAALHIAVQLYAELVGEGTQEDYVLFARHTTAAKLSNALTTAAQANKRLLLVGTADELLGLMTVPTVQKQSPLRLINVDELADQPALSVSRLEQGLPRLGALARPSLTKKVAALQKALDPREWFAYPHFSGASIFDQPGGLPDLKNVRRITALDKARLAELREGIEAAWPPLAVEDVFESFLA